MYKFYFGKNSEEQSEIEVNIEPSIQTEQKKGKKRSNKNTISLVFVEDKIIDEATDKIIAQTEKQSTRFVKMLEEQRLAKQQQEDIQDVLPGWKQPDFDELFSKIDNSIEEQFQRARAQAQIAAGLDFETKQQQRNRIEMEYRERRRRRQEEAKKLDKFKIFSDRSHGNVLSTIKETQVQGLTSQEPNIQELSTQEPTIQEVSTQDATITDICPQEPSIQEVSIEEVTIQEVSIQEISDQHELSVEEVLTEQELPIQQSLEQDSTIEESILEPGASEELSPEESPTPELSPQEPILHNGEGENLDDSLAVGSKEPEPTQIPVKYYPELAAIVGQDQEQEAIFAEPQVNFSGSFIDKKVDAFFEKLEGTGNCLGTLVGKMGEKSAVVIEKIDHMIHSLEARTERRITSIKRSIFRLEHNLERRKKHVAFISTTAIVSILMITFAVGNFTAYEYMYNGKILGIVKNQEEVYKTIDVIGDKLIYEHNAEITIDKKRDITFKRVLAVGKEIDDKEEILNRLTYMKDINAKGYAIVIEGMPTAIVASEQNARNILDEIQKQYLSNNSSAVEKPLGFEETVIIESTETKLGSIESEEKVLAKLMAATNKKEEGEAKPLLSVQTEEVLTYYEPIPYAIEYEDTMSKYKGETTVKSKGTEGQKEIVAKIIRTNGVEVEKEILKETTISQPMAQVVLRGTKEPPKLVGTGTFIYPIRGTLTSRFGYRWGSMHPALDIAAPTGTPIKASDGGTVTFAGYQGSYGYMVEIDHGGNRKTRYAHCSKLLVKVGQKVYQGMHIANVGNTGNSTGPHVHFEVLINGVQKNPLSYL